MNFNGMKILSIDDDIKNLSIIEDFAKPLLFDVDSFESPEKALLSGKSTEYDLVLVDYKVAELNGLEFIKAFRKYNSDIPIIMLSEMEDDINLQVEALHLGANDFLTKPINSASFQARVQNVLKLSKAESLLKDSEHEALEVLGRCAEYKEDKAGAHATRMAHYCKVLAKVAGLSKKVQDIAFYASQYHDLGKLGISDEILLKPGKLDESEFEVMKTHSRIGYEMLMRSKSGYLKAGAVICYSHHEKFDGSGYPIGLSGETIPILGRIVAIADVFDALTSIKVYKKAWSIEDACSLLIEEKGKHFDPSLVDLFIENLDEMKSIKNQFQDVSS